MKNLSLTFAFILVLLTLLLQPLRSQDISVSYASFYNENEKYVEVYLYAVGSTLAYDTLENGLIQASLDFTITFSQGDEIYNFDKFTLNSPPDSVARDFMEIKRFALENGKYLLKVNARDKNKLQNAFNFSTELSIDFNQTLVQLSDIQLLSAFKANDQNSKHVKSGYFLEPAAFNFFPQTINQLSFYLEVYNPASDSYKASYLSYAIYQKQANGDSKRILRKYKKLSDRPLQALILSLPIDALPSGNYELMVELRNRDKLLVDAVNQIFQRSNPTVDLSYQSSNDPGFEESFAIKLPKDDVRYTLKALAPVAKGMDGRTIEELFFDDKLRPKQYFIYNYFYDLLPTNPEFAFEQFMNVAKAVDKTYRSNVGYGFETDRGNIFMKYGKPTEVVHVEDEPSAPPYEIWFYNFLEESKQYNIKFIFYNPSLATNDFVLLHSNCRGERYNPRWEVELYKNAPNEQVGQNSASTRMEDNYRRNARKIWEEL
jgi:GWxTD domain-containing protein